MKFEVKNRYTGEVQFTAEIDCNEQSNFSIKVGLAVKWAIQNGAYLRGADLHDANLRGADLRGADLHDANLRGANLRGAYLSDAYLSGANLRDADLHDADLRDANLRGADLRDAYLSGANLRDADLHDADLRDAYLSDANLHDADLRDAYLSDANLRSFKHDLWGILIRYKNEVPILIDYIKKGKIDGSCYSGECSCLMGTFAKIKNLEIENSEFSIKDSSSPAEQWFSMIKPGDTPEDNFASKMALGWIEEFLMLDGHKNA